MQQNYSYKKFIVSNTKENLSAALNTISAYITEIIAHQENYNNIILRSKWVLTELLTNVVKHSNDNLVRFEIHKKNSLLEITRSDCGKPFLLPGKNQINSCAVESDENKRYILQKDDLCILYATVSVEGVLLFKVEDIEVIQNEIPDINEHFGLIIIARSSDEFIYKYENSTKTNVFKASFLL